MPNWCSNQLNLRGEVSDITEFVMENRSANGTEPLSFNAKVPRTLENGVDWGCKWDARDSEVYTDYDGGTVEYSFTTPWAPPEDWLIMVSKLYPKIEFILNFDEESHAFRGETVVRNGIKDEQASSYEEDYDDPEND